MLKKTTTKNNRRREFRNIHVMQIIKYKMPVAAVVSILHRVSGALMFLLLPFILYLFERSIISEISFDEFTWVMSKFWVKLIVLLLVWGYLHHFSSGIRHLILDIHIGLEKAAAARSARLVLWTSLSLTTLVGLKLFGVF